MIRKRVTHFFGRPSPTDIDRLYLFFWRLEQIAPPFIRASVLKSVCNSWVTSRRFPGPTQCCNFCGLTGGDDIRHLVTCPVAITHCSLPLLPSSFAAAPAASRLLLFPLFPLSSAALLSCAVFLDLVHGAHHALRHTGGSGPAAAARAIRARARLAASRDARVQAVLRGSSS